MLVEGLRRVHLELVIVLVQGEGLWGETLTCTSLVDNLARERLWVKRVGGDDLPVIEDALGEGLTTGTGTEGRVETKRLHDGEVCLDVVHGGAGNTVLLKDVTTAAGEHTVDATNGGLGALDLNKEDGLEEAGLGGETARVHATAGCGDNLTTTTVDGIGVKGDIVNVEADAAHVLVSKHALLCGPLETSDDRVLDLVQVLPKKKERGGEETGVRQ